MPHSLLTGQLLNWKKSRHIVVGVFVVHSSMVRVHEEQEGSWTWDKDLRKTEFFFKILMDSNVTGFLIFHANWDDLIAFQYLIFCPKVIWAIGWVFCRELKLSLILVRPILTDLYMSAIFGSIWRTLLVRKIRPIYKQNKKIVTLILSS